MESAVYEIARDLENTPSKMKTEEVNGLVPAEWLSLSFGWLCSIDLFECPATVLVKDEDHYSSVATASDNTYPIARPLFMYTNGEPEGAIKGYLDWIFSDQGQCIISDKGYAPAHAVDC